MSAVQVLFQQQAPMTWYSLCKNAESTYEIDTSANDSSDSLYYNESLESFAF